MPCLSGGASGSDSRGRSCPRPCGEQSSAGGLGGPCARGSAVSSRSGLVDHGGMTYEFDAALELAPPDPSDPDAGLRARFTDGWLIGNGVNGGVVMGLAATALRGLLAGEGGHLDLLAFSGYFLTPSVPGDARVHAEVLRTGRTLSTGQMSVAQLGPDGRRVERMRALASFGDLEGSQHVVRSVAPPAMPPPERCIPSAEAPPSFLAAATLLERLDLRIDPATAGWTRGMPSGRGELRGWLRLRDGREPDPVLLLFALDAMPPVAFDLGLLGWTPTLEFTGHVRGRPASGWLQVVLSTSHLAGGLMEEDARIWDSSGRLVAQSRQLCGVRMSSPPRLAEPGVGS